MKDLEARDRAAHAERLTHTELAARFLTSASCANPPYQSESR